MPGITGIISDRLSAENRIELNWMMKSLLHELKKILLALSLGRIGDSELIIVLKK
jgi:hypothetical protein